MKNPDCIFCKIAQNVVSAKKVLESDNFFAILDAYPKATGHTLIIPKKHFVTILDLKNNLGNELLKMIKDVSSSLLDQKKGDAFNILMNNLEPAGQVVMHAHIHIIPRKEGDKIVKFN
jgi:histidine triad (HIT) family protein